MKRLLPVWVAMLTGLSVCRADTIPLYVNNGVVSSYPADQIDAFAFVNYGEFDVQTLMPFDFENTVYITNYGTMQGLPGFDFSTAYAPPKARGPAATFVNDFGATIQTYPITVGVVAAHSPSYLLVSAENIYNQGLLSVSDAGWLKLAGQHVDVSRSGLEVRPAVGGGGGFSTPTNFYPDPGISDIWWGGETNQTMDASTLVQVTSNSVTIITPPSIVTNINAIRRDSFQLRNPLVGVMTNRIDDTNFIVQAVFVGFDTNRLSSRIHFTDFITDVPPWNTVCVELSMTETNIVTDETFQETLYLTDTLGSSTNYVMLTNLLTGVTFRPATYGLTRGMPIEFLLGGLGNARLSTNLIYDGSYSNTVLTNLYAAYAAGISALVETFIPAPGSTITNSPGKIEIFAKDVTLEDTRIRGNSLVSIQADHLISSAKTKIEAPNLIFNLASTNGSLQIQNLTRESILQFQGAIRAWSGLWTNQTGSLSTNIGPDPNDPTITVTNILTNVINIGFHVLALDANSLADAPTPVEVYEMTARSTNVVINDAMNVVGRLLIEADSWTLNGRITFSGGSGDFGMTNAPQVRFFTNTGTFSVPDVATLGADRSTPYASLINQGTMSASSHVIRADYFQNSGRITDSPGPLRVQAGVAKLEGGRNDAGNDVVLEVGDLKMHHYTNTSSGRVLFYPTNSITDTGGGANNSIVANRGVQLLRKPPVGDILGTRIVASTSRREIVPYAWGAEDRGVGVAGFTNNVALGRLTLSSGQDGRLDFHAPSSQGRYGLYVDVLDLQGFTYSAFQSGTLATVLRIDPNLTIYFAYSANGDTSIPAEELDGQLGGRLRWVRDFVGPSAVPVALQPSGRTILVNRGLRESRTIDSDGDGIANGEDLTPFPDTMVTARILTMPAPMTVLEWTAAPLTSYQVEYTTDLTESAWNLLTTVTNAESYPRQVTAQDPLEAGRPQRYYRVSYHP